MLQEVLKVSVEVDKESIIQLIYNRFFADNRPSQEDFLQTCAKKALRFTFIPHWS